MSSKKVYSLSQLTLSIQKLINTQSDRIVWIKAEIVKLNHYPKSGHCYPTLVEKKNGKVVAELRGNIWAANFEQINNKFQTVLKERLRDDMTVVIQGSVSFHPVHGLALNIVDIDPEYTLGELAREKADAINRLKIEGRFELNKRTQLPRLPKTIAIISVDTSKGYGDFMDVINKNPAGYKFHFLLFPAILQGERAVVTIMEQLDRIRNHANVFDAVAIIRGGGGEIGLSCFDNYALSAAIAGFPIPVLTGIGHSTNTTVSELVSYESFITPTKIAEFLIQKFHDFANPINENLHKLQNEISWIFKAQKTGLNETARLFNSFTGRAMESSAANLTSAYTALENISHRLLLDQKVHLDQAGKSIGANSQLPLKVAKRELEFAGEKIRMLSPENILKRGYSITRVNNKVVKDPDHLEINDILETQTYRGVLISRLEKIIKNPKK